MYHGIKPIYISIHTELRAELKEEYSNIKINMTILFIILLVAFLVLDFYECSYPLKLMDKSLSSTKDLIRLIPERKELNSKGYEKL